MDTIQAKEAIVKISFNQDCDNQYDGLTTLHLKSNISKYDRISQLDNRKYKAENQLMGNIKQNTTNYKLIGQNFKWQEIQNELMVIKWQKTGNPNLDYMSTN